MKIAIHLELDDDEYADPEHPMGITTEAFDRLTGGEDGASPPLGWLGEVQDVRKL